MDIILELSKFNHIKYFDDEHKYFVDGLEYMSATRFIGNFKPKFETEKIAKEYADKRGLKTDDVIRDWDFKRDKSTTKGTAIHNLAENWWNNKAYNYDSKGIVELFGHDVIKEDFDKCKKQFYNFYNDAKQNLIPVKLEMVVCDDDYKIAGQIDAIFYNRKSGMLEIWDYKTNKSITMSNDFGQKYNKPISHLDVCEINTYSLQLGLYKHIIEKNTNLKFGNSYLLWVNEKNDNYKVIKTKDLTAEIITMVETLN